MHLLLTGHGPSGVSDVSLYDGYDGATRCRRHAGGVGCLTAETGAHWRATTSVWWPPPLPCLIPIHTRAGRERPPRPPGSGGGGSGSALGGQVLQHARDRLIHGHPL